MEKDKNLGAVTRKRNSNKKTISMQWLDYPSHSPDLGEEIVVCYGDHKRKEVIMWQMKFVGTGIKFKFIRLPAIV